MIKRLLALTVALAVVALPAASQAKRSRTDSGEYNAVVANTDPAGPSAQGHITNGVAFTPRAGERFVSIVVQDESGLPAPAVVGQDLDGDGVDDVTQDICGQSASPIAFKRGIDVVVWAQEGPCEDGTMGAATFGTVTATFTR
jgi:hypothetical protein